MNPSRRTRAESALVKSGLMDKLAKFSPTVVSTIWVELDTEISDIDIVCSYSDADKFITEAKSFISNFSQSTIHKNEDRVLASLYFEDFLLELYASEKAIAQQPAYRHFKVMQRLVALNQIEFPAKIRELKAQGSKTEPAIAKLLELEGDPYEAVLDLEDLDDQQLSELLAGKVT